MKIEQKIIFVVDDSNTSLTACKNILKPHYAVYPAISAAKMFGLLEHIIPDLILMDVDMPEMNGYEAVGRLKKIDEYKNIPIIFLSGRVDPASEVFGLNMGAVDYIHKPFASELLLKRIKTNISLIETQKMLEERNKSADDFFSRSSEVITPLKKIIEILDTAVTEEDQSKSKNIINTAKTAVNELLSNVNSIFDISRTEKNK